MKPGATLYGRELLARVKSSQLICTKTPDGYIVGSDDTVMLAFVRENLGDLFDEITTLEERVAFAELARDNAIKQRDDTAERAKAKSESAGKRISMLVQLVRTIEMGDWARDRAEKRITEILGKDGE